MEINKELQSLLLATKTGKQLSEYHLKLLKKQKINTPHEFINAENLSKLLALSVDQVELIKRELLTLLVKSVKLKKLYQDNPHNYSTGIEDLDKLLDSIGQPLRPGRLWELYGETGVGKSQFLHTLAVNFVCKYKENQVLYIDIKHDFNSEFIYDILLGRHLHKTAIKAALNAIKVLEIPTADSLIGILKELLEKWASNDESVSRIKLIFIDSLAACYMLYRTHHDLDEGRSFLNELAMIVRKLAAQHGVAFVIGNLSFAADEEAADDVGDNDVNAVNDDELSQTSSEKQDGCGLLGYYWSSVCTLSLTLELTEQQEQRSNSDGLRLLRILNNSYGLSEGSCLLRLTDVGVI